MRSIWATHLANNGVKYKAGEAKAFEAMCRSSFKQCNLFISELTAIANDVSAESKLEEYAPDLEGAAVQECLNKLLRCFIVCMMMVIIVVCFISSTWHVQITEMGNLSKLIEPLRQCVDAHKEVLSAARSKLQ